jgi:hypothetical protein
MSISALEHLAAQLLLAKGDIQPLGERWIYNFLNRHPELKARRSRALDQARKDAVDHNTLQHWFELYQTIKLAYNIADDDTYNMDEKGCIKGIGDNHKVIVPRDSLEPTVVQPGNREWVSIIECISANNYVLPPFVIFQGKRIQQAWIPKDLDPQFVIRVSENGWTDCNIALEWIRHFDKYTAPRTHGKYRLLILDGHASHVSPQFVEYCEEHNIIPLCLPPYSTHELQPLDVGVFGPLAKAYRKLVTEGALFGAVKVDNHQFLRYYEKARACIFRNIPGAWRGAGLLPYNPEKVLARHRPAEAPITALALVPAPTSAPAMAPATAPATAPIIAPATAPITAPAMAPRPRTSDRPKTPAMVSITDQQGRRAELPVTGDMATKINQVVEELFQICDTPKRARLSWMKDYFLTMQADNTTLRALTQEVVKKRFESRKKSSRKHFGEARVLTVEDIRARISEREAKEAVEAREKERRIALRGVVGFAKGVWKDYKMGPDVFK